MVRVGLPKVFFKEFKFTFRNDSDIMFFNLKGELMSVELETFSVEQLQSMIRDESEFTKFFKKNIETIGSGSWIQNGKRGWQLTLPDGSYIRLKFFDTIKRIYNSKNIEIPGRESYFSYIDVNVMPKGIKGYGFTMNVSQHVMTPKKGVPPAKNLHQESIRKLYEIASSLKIDLTKEEAWETYYAGKV